VGAILSAALLLRHSLGLEAEAVAVERAVATALANGLRTADIAAGGSALRTAEAGQAIAVLIAA
jgi:3-isopropylmalate dehydrogenase